jgi:hypothetical protein
MLRSQKIVPPAMSSTYFAKTILTSRSSTGPEIGANRNAAEVPKRGNNQVFGVAIQSKEGIASRVSTPITKLCGEDKTEVQMSLRTGTLKMHFGSPISSDIVIKIHKPKTAAIERRRLVAIREKILRKNDFVSRKVSTT